MLKIKQMILLLLVGSLLAPPISRAQPQRGQGVRPVGTPTISGKHYALLIGVQKYQHPSINPLDYPLRDVEQVRQALTTDYNFAPQDVTVLPNPDRETILTTLDQLAEKLKPEDSLLVFYAGHGYWDELRRQGYWLPSDAQQGSRAKWISNGDLREAIRGIRARHTLLISDACFSGSLFVTREAFTTTAAIEEVSKLPSRTAMTSGAMTTVPDRSVFVNYLVRRLRENREAYLLAGDLYSQLRVPVINNSPRQKDGTIPTPRYGVIQEAGDEGGEFVFVRRTPPGTITPPVRMSVAGVALSAMSFTTANTNGNGSLINQRQEQCWGFVEDINGVKIELVEIAGGSFTMGGPEGEAEYKDEKPQHRVTVKGFLMGKTEVTQVQWRAVARLPKVKIDLAPDPSRFKGDDLPVEQVSWDEAVEFCERLSRKTGGRYRLPSEAEWEYAARAGTTTPFAFGATISPAVVNYDGNNPYGNGAKGEWRQKTVAAGSLPANGWGLHEMHGNVWEWCQDQWHDNYSGAPSDGSAWLGGGALRVLRGGGWGKFAVNCRSAYRSISAPDSRYNSLGFRLVRQ